MSLALRVAMIKGIYIPAIKIEDTGIIDTIMGNIHILDIIYVQMMEIPTWCEDCTTLLYIIGSDDSNPHIKKWLEVIKEQRIKHNEWVNSTSSC